MSSTEGQRRGTAGLVDPAATTCLGLAKRIHRQRLTPKTKIWIFNNAPKIPKIRGSPHVEDGFRREDSKGVRHRRFRAGGVNFMGPSLLQAGARADARKKQHNS